jgi:multicomponent Na+:H+ antiporter subunit F
MSAADWVGYAVLALFAAALLLGMVRLFIGPQTPDRIVAADTLGVITTAGLAVLALVLDSALYLDIALVYGVLAFVGVVALARIIETGKRA